MKKKLLSILTLLLTVCSGAWATDYTWTFDAYCTSNSISSGSNKNIKDKNAGLADVEVSTNNEVALTYSCGASNTESKMYNLSSAQTVSGTSYNSYLYMGGSSTLNSLDRVFKTGSAITGTGILTIVYSTTASGTCSIYDADDTSTALTTLTPATSTAVSSAVLNLGTGKKLLISHSAKCAIYAIKWTEVVTHSVSAVTSIGTDTYGTVAATSTTVEEGGTTTITATPASGYKVTNWAVSGTGASISPEGASNSLTTTLTMGTADATVTVTFGAASGLNVTHTLTNVTATSGATGENAVTEGSEYTAVFAANSGYVLPDAVTVTIGGSEATAGTEYTWNKATGTITIGAAYVTGTIVITVTGEAAYTLTYVANGGTGSMANTVSKGSITLTANAYTKSGYTFMGWATSQANADAGTVAYADGAAYTLSADATLYAVWAANDYSFAVTESSGTLSSGDVVATSTGGKMVYTPTSGGSPTLKYSTTSDSNCVEFGAASQCQVTVTLDKKMQAGTIITLNYYVGSANARGFYLANSSGTTKATFSQTVIGTYTESYTVVADDGLEGSNVFLLKRYNNAYLNSVTVVNCANEYVITPAKTYTTLTSAYALDFTGSALKAYIAKTAISDGKVTLTQVNKVPANTGLVIKTEDAGTAVNVPILTGDADDVAGNYMFGSATSTTAVAANAGYILSDGVFQPASAGDLPAGKAYLAIAVTSAPSLQIVLDDIDGISTGINAVQGEELKVDGEYYNLAGQRVAQPTKGLYIVNGKKYIVK